MLGLVYEAAGGFFEGLMKGSWFSAKVMANIGKPLSPKNLKKSGQSALRNLKEDYHYNANKHRPIAHHIPGIDTVVAPVMGGLETVANRAGNLLGRAIVGGVSAAAWVPWQILKGTYKGTSALSNVVLGARPHQIPWRIARTIGQELPHEAWANSKIAWKAGKQIVKTTNSPTVASTLIGTAAVGGFGYGMMQAGAEFGEGTALHLPMSIKNAAPHQRYWIDPDTGQMIQSGGPNGEHFMMASSKIFSNDAVYSPYNTRARKVDNLGADGGLAFAMHNAR